MDDPTITRHVVHIKFVAIFIDGEPHLEMQNDDGCRAIDGLITVCDGKINPFWKIIWQKGPDSHINRIQKIEAAKPGSVIFENGVDIGPNGDQASLDLPDLGRFPEEEEIIEKYNIEITLRDYDKPIVIDPYIRIRPR